MKPEIHPEYNTVKATCSCGNVIEMGSTLSEDIHVDVCSKCHPFYTGKQKIVDSGGRVERFRKRFGNRSAAAVEPAADAAEADNASASAKEEVSAKEAAPAKEAAAPAKDAAPAEDS